MDILIEVEVRFLTAEEGGRQHLPDLRTGYRPHLCVPPNGTLLGVEFVDGSAAVQPNTLFRATVHLLYFPTVDYSSLTAGTHFDIVEGSKVVGHGVVCSFQ